MATVTLTITDEADGGAYHVVGEFDPPYQPKDEPTPAQKAALYVADILVHGASSLTATDADDVVHEIR